VQNAKLAYLLAEEKRRVESVLENTADGIMDIDSNRRIISFNKAMEKLTSCYDREEVLGKECFRVLVLRDWENDNLCNKQCPMLASSEGGDLVFEQEGKIQAKDGQSIDVAMAYSIIRSLKEVARSLNRRARFKQRMAKASRSPWHTRLSALQKVNQ